MYMIGSFLRKNFIALNYLSPIPMVIIRSLSYQSGTDGSIKTGEKIVKTCNKIFAAVLAFIMLTLAPSTAILASGGTSQGKYISDVYIVYAKTEDEAVQWLKDNGWEPIKGSNDFNAGKASFWDGNKTADQNVAAAMGIKRTNNSSDAITDMHVFCMMAFTQPIMPVNGEIPWVISLTPQTEQITALTVTISSPLQQFFHLDSAPVSV